MLVKGCASVAGDGRYFARPVGWMPEQSGILGGGGVDPTDGLLADEHPDPRTDLIDSF
jgi:hypothetical protein